MHIVMGNHMEMGDRDKEDDHISGDHVPMGKHVAMGDQGQCVP